jgi:hypothetical protein
MVYFNCEPSGLLGEHITSTMLRQSHDILIEPIGLLGLCTGATKSNYKSDLTLQEPFPETQLTTDFSIPERLLVMSRLLYSF